MTEIAKARNPLMLIALIFLVSGPGLMAASQLIVEPPASQDALRDFAGVIEATKDITHYKAAAYDSSFTILIRGAGGEAIDLDIVKQRINGDAQRALVGRKVLARHARGVAYELMSDGETLVTYEKTAAKIASEEGAFFWPGVASLIIGAALLAWSAFANRMK